MSKRHAPDPFPIRLQPAVQHGDAQWLIEIPDWHPHRLNEFANRHWAVRRKLKFEDAIRIAVACRAAGVTGAIGKRGLAVTIVLAKGQRGGDPDAYDKSPHDGLKRSGAIRDDNRQWLQAERPEFDRSTTKRTILRLSDI